MGSVQLNILVVTLPYQGHMNPMLKLAKHLATKGLHVTIATTNVARLRLQKNCGSVKLEFFSDGLSPEFDRDNNFEQVAHALESLGSQNLSNLITNLSQDENKNFSCIITNPFIPWVTDVASKHNIPCAILWIQACAVFSIYYHYFKNPKLFPSLHNPNDNISLPGMPIFKVKDLPSFIMPSEPLIFKKLLADFIKSLDKVNWVLGNSFDELENGVVKSMDCYTPIIPIGPLVSPFLLGKQESLMGNVDFWSAEESCIEWLDKQATSSVIYISFGSISVLSQTQMDSVANALKDSQKPFLWVIKPPEKGSQKKMGALSFEFLEETKERGLVVTWCPQEKVLMHKSVACFLTHCGWNSTVESVASGVPVIAYPEWTDQPTDAKLLVDVFKVGVRMSNDENKILKTEEVARCIREMTEGPRSAEMKKRAMELREAAKKAVESGGSSDKSIDRFISEIIVKSS